jgi:molybdopterin/thiamine biosynthesis adenylyltransferase
MDKNLLFHQIDELKQKRDETSWKPEIINPNNSKELERLSDIIENCKPIVTDDIIVQVAELVKCLYPKERLSGERQHARALDHFGSISPNMYGVWVYYPWSNRLVHLLDESEFSLVRTNRNHYKISPEEQALLANRKIGLIGLSVGQSVAVTLAMERGFGELRLADFDVLELTNLNRIRTGVQNLGISKVVSVAREIMEIDPYLKLRCFTDGITEENLDTFFTEGGKLDLLIDECDGLEVKVLCRHKAREYQIPVVMEASDRGMVDVERFDLEPNRPLLHGLMGELDPEKLKTLTTNEEKIPYMLDIVGIDTISTRAKASMLEIGETITTWPQLASAVALGGGITADVVRRIFLDQFHDSGRYYMDVEQIIGDKKTEKIPEAASGPGLHFELENLPIVPLTEEETISEEDVNQIVEAACHAPSGGNLQPWHWIATQSGLQLNRISSLTSEFLDHNLIASYIALGASIENACLKANDLGYLCKVSYFPIKSEEKVVAHLGLIKSDKPLDIVETNLGRHVLNRYTNRNIEPSISIKENHIAYLHSIATKNGSKLTILNNGKAKDELSELIAFAERFRILHPIGHKNFVEEMRWTDEEVQSTRDGIDIATCDLDEGEMAGFKLATNHNVIEKLIEWNGGSAFEKLSKKSTQASSALGIISRKDDTSEDFLNAGRDLERVWIGANIHGIGFQPQSPISLILQRLESGADLNNAQKKELQEAQDKIQSILSPLIDGKPIFIFRLFYETKPVVKSLRRPLKKHFTSLI